MAALAGPLVACNGGKDLAGDTGKKSSSSSSDGEGEDEPSDEPTMVSGAFLTACGPATDPAGGLQDGNVGMGCAVLDAATNTKTTKPVEDPKVEVRYQNDTKEKPKVSLADGTSPWHVYFQIPLVSKAQIKDIMLTAKVGGDAFDGASHGATYDPTNPASAGGAPKDAHHIVFITKKTYTPGNEFQSLTTADVICGELGFREAYPTWKAVLGDTNLGAKARVHIDYPVYDLGGNVVAQDEAAFWSADRAARIAFDEKGAAVPADSFAWTGTGADGQTLVDTACGDWKPSSANAGAEGTVGAVATSAGWLDAGTKSCASAQHLYCISQ